MRKENLIDLFRNISVWKQGDKRAPHKPLLILYLLGRILKGEGNSISFNEVDIHVGKLLNDFGPKNKTQALYPFWYLQNDGFWHLSIREPTSTTLGAPPTKGRMQKERVTGSLSSEVYNSLKTNPEVTHRIIREILEAHFPSTLHEDILQEIGIPANLQLNSIAEEAQNNTVSKRKRDPNFREKILRAYEYKCAVCGFDVRMGSTSIGLEAAHIKWHQAGGPDVEHNGLALCSLHHKLFDRGAFTLSNNMIFLVSDNANGTKGFSEWLMNFHGKPLRMPQRTAYTPNTEFTTWHVSEVFRGTAREYSI